MKRQLGRIAAAFLVLALVAATATQAQAPTFTVLHSFTNSGGDGALPPAGLVIDAAGNLYGTTSQGGSLACNSGVTNAVGCGTVFKLDPFGNETILYSFMAGNDGALPAAGLIMDAAGKLYGTTAVGGGPCPSGFGGGFPGCGTAFKLDAAGAETVLHRFTLLDGVNPRAGLIMDSAGNLYGTAQGSGPGGSGTVFKLDPAGNLTVLHAFTGGSDGVFPFAGLVMDAAGNLYGTTFFGGGSSTCGGAFGGCGIVFKVDPSGKETVLHSFTGPDGLFPVGGLIMDAAGNFYGTTSSGGASSNCPGVSNVVGCGTVFKLDTSGNLTVLHSFTNSGGDGAQPVAGLILDKAGNLYGTTQLGGGSSSGGTVFKLDASGNLTVLHSFLGIAGGGQPLAPLIMDNAGNLYGTTFLGGSSSNCSGGCGTVFKLTFQTPQTRAYVANESSNSVSVIDTSTNTVTATVGVGVEPLGVAITPDGTRAYVANAASTSSSVSVINTLTNTVTATVGVGSFPSGVAITPDGTRAYVVNEVIGSGSGSVSVIDTLTNTVTATVGVGSNPLEVAITPDGTRAYVTNFLSGSVSVIDTSTNTVTATVGVGSFPYGVAITPDGTRAYVATDGSNSVSVINTSTNKVTATVGVGAGPVGVAITPFTVPTPVPTITSISPTSAITGGAAFTLTVNGTNFVSGSMVNFNGNALATTFVSATQLTAIIPGFDITTAGTDSVTVTNPGDGTSNAFTFTVNNPVPTITSLSPSSTLVGGAAFTLTVNGTGFVSTSVANLGGSVRATTFVSPTQLAVAILASDIATAGAFGVTVTNPAPGGGTSSAVSFTVLTPQQATQAIINSVNVLLFQGVINGGQDNSLLVQLQHAITMMNAGKNAGAIGNLDSFISEVNDLLSSGVLSPSQAASLVGAAESVIAAI